MKYIHDWLIEIGIRTPICSSRGNEAERSVPSKSPPDSSLVTIAYHESCHLCHGQKITNQPRQVLRAVPGLKMVELPEASWCCGSAGIYNLVQPEMANELLQRKLKH